MRRGNSDSFGAVDELRAWCCYCNKIYSFIHLKLFLYFCPLTFRVILYRRCYLLLSEAPRLTASRKSIYLLHNINHVSSNKSLPHSFGDISITALCTHLRVYLWYLHSQFHRELWNVQRFFIKYLYHLGGGVLWGWLDGAAGSAVHVVVHRCPLVVQKSTATVRLQSVNMRQICDVASSWLFYFHVLQMFWIFMYWMFSHNTKILKLWYVHFKTQRPSSKVPCGAFGFSSTTELLSVLVHCG